MTEYIEAVLRGLRDEHGICPTGGTEEAPLFESVPDGEYPMTIDGRVDRVKTEDGNIRCCRFNAASERT